MPVTDILTQELTEGELSRSFPLDSLYLLRYSINMSTAEEKQKEKEKTSKEHHYKIETVLTWKAPARPFKKRTRAYFRTSILIAFLVEVILFLFQDYPAMLVVLAFLFLSFALASVPPHENEYKISTEGFTLADHSFLWQELYDFYFKQSYGQTMLHIRTQAFLPGELVIPLGTEVSKDQVKTAIVRFLSYREVVKPTFMEKSGDWLSRTFPLESASVPEKSKSKVAS